MKERSKWNGALSSFARAECTTTLAAPLRQAETGAFPFLGVATTGQLYWIKTPGNPHGDHSLATERIVSAVGQLIDAPVRPTELIEIPDGFERWPYGDGRVLRACTGHGSVLLENTVEHVDLMYSEDDDNQRRQAKLYALWEWCCGTDAQWLYEKSNENSIWSFDHGLWFDSHEAPWSNERFMQSDILPPEPLGPVKGLDSGTFHAVADKLDAVAPDAILGAIASVPISWSIADDELETVAWHLYNERERAASKLRRIAAEC